jgi:hypothetical protein
MPDNTRRWISAGEDMALTARLLTDGHTPAGITGSLANGNSAALKRMYGIKTTPIALPEPVVVTVTGDDTRLGIFQFDPESLPSFQLTAGEVDLDIVSNSQGTSIYTIGTYYDLNLLGPTHRDFNDMLLWVVSQAKSRVSGNKGTGFHSLVIPRCNMTYLGRNFEERTAATFTFQVTVDVFDTFPWGGLIGNNAMNKNEGVMFEWFTNKRPQVLVIKDDTSTNSYQMEHAPWTDGNGNVRFIAWRNGVVVGSTGATAAVAVAANKTVTLGAGLTSRVAGDTIFIFAEVA